MIRQANNRLLRVAVSQRVEHVAARDEIRDTLDQRLVAWLLEVGALAFPVPNGLLSQDNLKSWLKANAPQAVVLSGGNDIGSCPERDATEVALLDHAAASALPLLGICRGMQMMAHYAGTTLLPVQGHAGTRHSIRLCVSNETLQVEVNSYHDWRLAGCPNDYEMIAMASDDTPEAIRHQRLPWEGWMWHPEREAPFEILDIERARRLLLGE